MDLYTAFMRTADRIERKPFSCRITETDIPKGDADYGCILGWVAYEMKMRVPHADYVLREIGLEHFTQFSSRMIALWELHGKNGTCWYYSKDTPQMIRDYAERYLEKPTMEFDPALTKLLESLDSAPQSHMIQSPVTGDV